MSKTYDLQYEPTFYPFAVDAKNCRNTSSVVLCLDFNFECLSAENAPVTTVARFVLCGATSDRIFGAVSARELVLPVNGLRYTYTLRAFEGSGAFCSEFSLTRTFNIKLWQVRLD